ncbi:MAG: hypothetical protein ABSA76_15970 [Bacteroidales bacterium]
MEINPTDLNGERFCKFCKKPLSSDEHGNRKSHLECSYKNKLYKQKQKYKVGNNAKLMIQKNEAVAARLYEMDKQKNGIPFTYAMEQGFRFDCPTLTRKNLNKTINMFDHYGYVLETLKSEILIFIYHESELLSID